MKTARVTWTPRRSRLWLAAVLALGFAFRLAVTLSEPMGLSMFSDDNTYIAAAVAFVRSGHIDLNGAIGAGMPLLLGALFSVFGYQPAGLILSHILFSCIGLLTAYGVYLLGSLLHSRQAGLLACAVMAFEPGVVSQNCVFITETPYMCLTVFALYFLLRCVLCWRMRYFYAGLACFCAAALLKGLAVLIPLAVLLYALRRRVPLVKWLPRIVLALVTCALILLPFSVQNKLSGGSLAPFSTSQGDQKLLGTYWGLGYPEGSYDQALAALYSGEQERDEKIASRGEYADERYAQWISENPAGFLFTQLMYKPAALITQNYYIKILGIPIRLVNVLWWGVLALAACGVVGSRRRRAERPPGFYVPLLYLALAVPITAIWIPIARYNAPHVPLIAFYAAVGMLDLWAWVRRAGKRKAAASTL